MKLVVCFPGIGYHCDKPLLYYSRKLATAAGYDASFLLEYTCKKDGLCGNPAALHAAFDILYAQAESQLSGIDWAQYDEVLFLSKSIGTAIAAAYAQRHNLSCRQILYTPLSLTFAFSPQNAVSFLGTADPWSDTEEIVSLCRESDIPIYLYDHANHSLETPDVLQNIDILRDSMQNTADFIFASHPTPEN